MSDRRLPVAAGLLLLAGGAFAVLRERPSPRPVAPAASAPAPTPPAAPVEAASSGPSRVATVAPSPSVAAPAPSSAASVEEPEEPADTFVARDRLLEAVTRRGTAALPELLAVDPAADGYATAAAIQGMAKLAKEANPADRERIRARLDDILRAEEVRAREGGRGAAGNASLAVEALLTVGDDASAARLVKTLADPETPIHHATLIVAGLGELAYKPAAPVIEEFAGRVAKTTPEDPLDQELRTEALAAAEKALTALR